MPVMSRSHFVMGISVVELSPRPLTALIHAAKVSRQKISKVQNLLLVLNKLHLKVQGKNVNLKHLYIL